MNTPCRCKYVLMLVLVMLVGLSISPLACAQNENPENPANLSPQQAPVVQGINAQESAPGKASPARPSPVPSTMETLNAPFDTDTIPQSLSSDNAPLREQGPRSIDPADIPEILMNEMKEIERNCEANYFYSSFHNCRCVAVKFLDERLKSDPDIPQSTIFKRVNAQCPDKIAIAGFVYRSCYDFMKFHRPDDYVDFCECAAKDVAEKYAARPAVNLRYIESLRKKAFIGCGMGQNRLYKTPPPVSTTP